MTAFGMISKMQLDDGRGPFRVRGWSGGGAGVKSMPKPTTLTYQKAVVVDAPTPRPQPVVEAFVKRSAPAVLDPPTPLPQPTTIQTLSPSPTASTSPDLPPILPAAPVAPPKAAGFLDQELIPGVKNLYLAGGALGLVVLLALFSRKK